MTLPPDTRATQQITRREFSAGFLAVLLCGALKSDDASPFKLAVRKVKLSLGISVPFSFIHFSDTHLTEATSADRGTMAYHAQVVMMDGKTWFSRPFVAEKPSGMSKMRVFDVAKKEMADVQLPSVRVPDLSWDFSPKAGQVALAANGVEAKKPLEVRLPGEGTDAVWLGGYDRSVHNHGFFKGRIRNLHIRH